MNQFRESMRRPGAWRGVILFAIDLIVPTIILYLALNMGAGMYLALLISAGWSAATGLYGWLRGQSRGGARFMLLVSLASFAISFVTGSDRFLLARESVITALAGGWFLMSLRDERPLAYRLSRPLLEGRFGTTMAWEPLWESSRHFRHIWRTLTAAWGVVTLLDAVLRVVIAYTMPITAVPALQTALMIGTALLMQVVTNAYFIWTRMWPLLHGIPEADVMSGRRFSRPNRQIHGIGVPENPPRHS